jgi:hypothetical protein
VRLRTNDLAVDYVEYFDRGLRGFRELDAQLGGAGLPKVRHAPYEPEGHAERGRGRSKPGNSIDRFHLHSPSLIVVAAILGGDAQKDC